MNEREYNAKKGEKTGALLNYLTQTNLKQLNQRYTVLAQRNLDSHSFFLSFQIICGWLAGWLMQLCARSKIRKYLSELKIEATYLLKYGSVFSLKMHLLVNRPSAGSQCLAISFLESWQLISRSSNSSSLRQTQHVLARLLGANGVLLAISVN